MSGADHSTQDHHSAHHGQRALVEPSVLHAEHGSAQSVHGRNSAHAAHVDHTGHELVFRNRFWVCLALNAPVLLYSHMIQMWFGFTMPRFPGSDWIGPSLP